MTAKYRLGVDIGGTFTDALLIAEESGQVWSDKVLTTPADPSVGFLQAVVKVIERSTATPDEIVSTIHASTVATNAIIERTGAPAGLITTSGFRDVLEIARQIRHELYNLQTDKPQPLIPRQYCVGVDERIDHSGEVLVPLDEASVERALEIFRAASVTSIAVCLLHSYRSPAHEHAIRELAKRVYPEATLSLSCEIAPEIREYWRASTTVMNAYVAPIVSRYVSRVRAKLDEAKVTAPLYLMQSNGGITDVSTAVTRPVHLIESGPAAGVAVSAHFCDLTGHPDAIAFDMGGTTAKMGLIRNGRAAISSEFEVGGGWSGTPLVRGSGYPILGSVVDLVEVGAGGGSIAWIDAGGVLKVGPRSAGADPGPVSYGRGGVYPTVTDANLVLGRLDPEYFAGGNIELDPKAAGQAIEKFCARPLQMTVASAAMGIVDIANATMVQAMRLVSVQRGQDPRELALVATGGAGPLHANALAAELRIPRVIIPPSPGVASALGMLVSDLRWDARRTVLVTGSGNSERLIHEFDLLEGEAHRIFATSEVRNETIVFEHFVEMRYVGQSWKLRIPVGDDDHSGSRLRAEFDAAHETAYGYKVPEDDVEIVNVGITAIGKIKRPSLKYVNTARRFVGPLPVFFRETGGFVECRRLDRYSLREGDKVEGPALVQEVDSTTVVHPGYRADVIEYGTLIISEFGS